MTKKIEFTVNTKRAIYAVSCAVVPDMGRDGSDAAIVAETTLDADRLAFFGYPEADAEYKALCKAHGFCRVRRAAERFVATA